MNSNMKILILDIETCPHLVWTWSLWPKAISPDNIVESTHVLSWSAKWAGQKAVYYKNRNQKGFLERIWDLLDQADAVVTYNGDNFDMKHLHREFVEADMSMPYPSKSIDLLKTVRKRFKFPSNRLSYVARELLGESKLESGGWATWMGCLANERQAWKDMKKYNKGDVELTEKLYFKLLGWIPNHPNHGLFVEDQDNLICRNCGSDHIHSKGWQPATTNVRGYQRYKCQSCGANLRGRQMIKGGAKSPQVTT